MRRKSGTRWYRSREPVVNWRLINSLSAVFAAAYGGHSQRLPRAANITLAYYLLAYHMKRRCSTVNILQKMVFD